MATSLVNGKIPTLEQHFKADIGELVEKHGCSHFLDRALEPVEMLQNAIKQLEPVSRGPHSGAERACLKDLHKLSKKYQEA